MNIRKVFARATGNPVVTDLRDYGNIVEEIKKSDLKGTSAEELKSRLRALREEASDSPERAASSVFPLVREASRRAVGLDPFDVQMIAGLVMVPGGIAELPTGEGKTLAAVFPACLHALGGRGVHILTFNDYLARRDAAWMGPIYRLLGLSVGCVQEGMDPAAKRAAYAADVTYATAKEAGFDYLRDGIAYDVDDLVHRPFHYALVDEADSILIDEARIPLVISGVEDRATWDARHLSALIRQLDEGRDFETDAERRNVFLTDAGIGRIEALLGEAVSTRKGTRRFSKRSAAPCTPRRSSNATWITSSATGGSRSWTNSRAGWWPSATGPTVSRPRSKPKKGWPGNPKAGSWDRSPSSTFSGCIRAWPA